MNLIQMTLQNLLTNWKTTTAGLVYAFAKFVIPILIIWIPEHQLQLEKTATILEGGAIALGLFAAGDSNKSAKSGDITTINQTLKTHEDVMKSGDTSLLQKPKP